MSVTVRIPPPLRTFTNATTVESQGATVSEVLGDLFKQFEGMEDKVMPEGKLAPHLIIFVDGEDPRHDPQGKPVLDWTVTREVAIMQGVAGG